MLEAIWLANKNSCQSETELEPKLNFCFREWVYVKRGTNPEPMQNPLELTRNPQNQQKITKIKLKEKQSEIKINDMYIVFFSTQNHVHRIIADGSEDEDKEGQHQSEELQTGNLLNLYFFHFYE